MSKIDFKNSIQYKILMSDKRSEEQRLRDKIKHFKERIDNYKFGSGGMKYSDLCAEHHFLTVQLKELTNVK